MRNMLGAAGVTRLGTKEVVRARAINGETRKGTRKPVQVSVGCHKVSRRGASPRGAWKQHGDQLRTAGGIGRCSIKSRGNR
jgi:hypothetical protein